MISSQVRNREWIMKVRESSPRMDPILIEKMIIALILVEELSNSKLNFIFKGGTSLSLVLGMVQRFSIDIDIVISENTHMEGCFNEVIKKGVFLRYEEDVRESTFPKKHFKFFFNSEIQMKESHILLDVLIEENLYPQLKEFPIKSAILSIEGNDTYVKCPTPVCLLGDKLTAFAPHTTGINYGKEKELEIIKQLFDISVLFDFIDDIKLVKSTFESIASKQLAYRDLTKTPVAEVIQDTFNTGVIIGLRGYSSIPSEYQELVTGISRLRGFIISGNFTPDTAILCASKVTYLAALITKNENHIDRFDPGIDLSSWLVQNHSYSRINRLKKTNPEAFSYYFKAFEKLDILSDNSA